MRASVVVLLLLLPLPAPAFAQTPPSHPPPACHLAGHHPRGHQPHLQCMGGAVHAVTTTTMTIQPGHGHSIGVLFSAATVFRTDSGPGTLDGIVPGDYACVTGSPHGHIMTAQLVVFDLSPFPCGPKKPHAPPKHRPPAHNG